ncbi:MAG: bifunctional riboflavin kinase/FAD synthetase [Bradyrhizobiaceae bacterium]|nr:bifunctional riboflavin kinase/FAD synthetase [Bradyrhizobiaceae bacterium]
MTIPPAIPAAFSVLRDGDPVPARLAGGFVAIGNFDGIHRGHRAALNLAIARAREAGSAALALTFEPHPRRFFLPQAPTFRLTPEPIKLRLFAAAGLDGAVVLLFDAALASHSAEDFVSEILVGWLKVGGVVVGDNFHFGKRRLGTPAKLREEGARRGFRVDVLDRVTWRGTPVSSGTVRVALGAGDVAGANDLLGYRWFVEGEVIRGAARGRELGFPTANIALDPDCGLRHGIYAARVTVEGVSHDAVASFGRRPQFDNGAPLLEVMLFDFSGDLYGKTLNVEFAGFIRPEEKFASVEALKARMTVDLDEARAILARDRAGKP